VTTGNWVTDGTTFYLVDVSNGKVASAVNVLASVTVRIGTPQSVTSFTATPVNLPRGYTMGATTLTWSAPTTNSVEIHVNSPTGPLFNVGMGSGTVTTDNWVVSGTRFYLLDVQNPQSPITLASVSPVVSFNVAPTFTLSPSTIFAPYSPQGLLGSTTVSWNSPYTPNVEVHINAPNGALFTAGASTGSAAANGWVTDGTVFYLQDVSNGFPLNANHTLATATAKVLLQGENGYLLAAQNPVQNPAGSLGSATLNWSTSTATNVEVHVNAPDGPTFTGGGPQGSATASGWVKDGTVFYLQDRSNGEPLTTQFTIATQTIRFTPNQPQASFQASANPILVSPGTQFGATNLYWTAPSSAIQVEVHVGSPSGATVTQGLTAGSVTTGAWVTDGTVFYLQDVTKGKPLTSDNTLATLTVHLKSTQ
jgi:hypothetical protein